MSLDGIPGVIDSATRTVSAVTGAVGAATAAVGAVAGAVTGVQNLISSGPAGALNAIQGALGGAFGSVTTFLKQLSGVTLPLPNPLHAYASYTYILGIGCLTEYELNHPDSTYKKGSKIRLICKDANTDPNNRVNTAYGKFDFFIDDLTLDQAIGFDPGGNNTTVQSFTFKVIEPLSMGLFMTSCQQVAQEQGWDNWREAPYILTIEFRGNKENGTMGIVPNTTSHIPFNFTDLSMTVSEKGAVYTCSAMPADQVGLTDAVANMKSDSTAVGKTVQEILQSGEKSLQSVINDRAKQLEKQKIVEQADEYLILFPSDVSSAGSGGEAFSEESSGSATTSSSGADAIYSTLGVTRDSATSLLVQSSSDCNAIGKASLGFDELRKADPPLGKDNLSYKNGTFVRGTQTFDSAVTEMKFTQDTSVPAAINQVLLQSNFVNETLDINAISPEGYRGWYRIDTKVYNIGPVQKGTGTCPKLIVYRVVPYNVHSSRLMPPNTKAPGFDNLQNQIVKEYNYIYTGKNVDVLSFEIKIENGFTYEMAADGAARTQDAVTSAQTGGADAPDIKIKPMPDGSLPSSNIGVMPTILKWVSTKLSTDGKGGGGQEGQAQRAAKLFNDALNSEVDMFNLSMEILGDPYWIAASGTGNYTAAETQYSNLNADGQVNYENGEVDIVVNFRTPIDINQTTGLYNMTNTAGLIKPFSGFYCVNYVTSKFSKGKFTQTLEGFRRPQQENPVEATAAQTFATSRTDPTPPSDNSYDIF